MRTVFVVLLVVCFSQAFGQIAVGAKAGLNLSSFNLEGNDFYDDQEVVGFYAGGFVNIPIFKIFAIQPELLYSAQGGEYRIENTENGFNFTSNETQRLNYLTVPVMFQFRPIKLIYVELGPQAAFLLSEDLDISVNGISNELDRDFNDLDLSVHIGAGINLQNLSIQARYGASLIAVNNFYEENTATSRLLQLGISYKF